MCGHPAGSGGVGEGVVVALVRADAAADQEPAREKAGQAAGRAHGQWQSMKADAAAKMRGLQGRMDHQRDELDVKMAEDDAEGTEEDALDALGFAGWAMPSGARLR